MLSPCLVCPAHVFSITTSIAAADPTGAQLVLPPAADPRGPLLIQYITFIDLILMSLMETRGWECPAVI